MRGKGIVRYDQPEGLQSVGLVHLAVFDQGETDFSHGCRMSGRVVFGLDTDQDRVLPLVWLSLLNLAECFQLDKVQPRLCVSETRGWRTESRCRGERLNNVYRSTAELCSRVVNWRV